MVCAVDITEQEEKWRNGERECGSCPFDIELILVPDHSDVNSGNEQHFKILFNHKNRNF